MDNSFFLSLFSLFIGCLPPLSFFLFIIAIAVIAPIISRQNREGQKATWQQLAATHHLNFVSNNSSLGNGAYVNGIYRDHPIVLETITKQQGKHSVTYTRIGVFTHPRQANRQPSQDRSNPPLPPVLSFQEAIGRFTSLTGNYKIKAEPNGYPIYYEQPGVIKDTKFLEYLFDLLTNLAEAYPVVVAQGGEAIPALQPALKNSASKQIALRLLGDIAPETSKRLAHRAHRLLCPRCLTRFGRHSVDLPWQSDPIYYGCRMCSQSREFYVGSVVAVLDNQGTDTPVQQNDVIALRTPEGVRVNWSTRRQLFDFDVIEIIQATDEEVERFAVQVGNDTDITRKARYQKMQCAINPNCQLSENTLRILRRTFGQVVSGEEGSWQSKESELKDKPINRLSEDEKLSEQESS